MNNVYNDGQIHGWNGGECPVHPETVVEYWLRDRLGGAREAGGLLWGHGQTFGDINAIPAVQPTVKPLVWRSNGKGHVCADTPFGLYEVEHGRYGMRLLHGGSFMQDDLQGIEAAKAAAQADYDARILSALDMQPTVSPELLATTNDVAALVEAVDAAFACGMIPKSSVSEGGANKYIYQVRVADQLRAALARVKG